MAMIVAPSDYDYENRTDLCAFTVGASTVLKSVEIWSLETTTEGFFEAQQNRIWEPQTE